MAYLPVLILALTAGQTTETSRPLASVTLGAPESAEAQTISLSMVGGLMPQNRQEWSARSWSAVRRSSRGGEEINSTDCPALQIVATEFRDLPPISPLPDATLVRDEPFTGSTMMLGGFRTTVSFTVVGGAKITVSGVDAYASWGTKVASALIPCWSQPFP